jgi:hypothetical protein
MTLLDLWAFIKALPKLVDTLGEVVSTLKQLRQDAINKELDVIKRDVSITLKQISEAKTNDERKKLSIDLANRYSV